MVAVCVLIMAVGCRRVSHNGKLDGNWRVETVELFKESGMVKQDSLFHPEDRYIAFQLELVQIRPNLHTGIITYDDKSGQLSMEFPKEPSSLPKVFLDYGICENPVTFTVEADSKHLVLKNASAVVTCRRW